MPKWNGAVTLRDRRLRRHLAKYGLPDLPEVRTLMRLSFWNGFTSGALERRLGAARREALRAMARQSEQSPHVTTPPPPEPKSDIQYQKEQQ